MGDANASIPTPQPVMGRPMFASKSKAASSCSIAFVSRRCIETGKAASYGLSKPMKAISNTRVSLYLLILLYAIIPLSIHDYGCNYHYRQ